MEDETSKLIFFVFIVYYREGNSCKDYTLLKTRMKEKTPQK